MPKDTRCPVCKKHAEAVLIREVKNGLVSMEMNLLCKEDKMFWTPDLGWKPLEPKLKH